MEVLQLQKQAVEELLKRMPDAVGKFADTEYPLPVKTTILGGKNIIPQSVREKLLKYESDDIKLLVEPVLLGAELIEAAKEDNSDYFIKDSEVRSYVFNSKWRAGWVLVLGENNNKELVEELKNKNFLVFSDQKDADAVYIGDRDTSPIYFLQLMVRYGLIWGRIKPGDDHEMGHFLEKDMPGYILITEDLPALKYIVALGLMKLGAPAVVPSSFPFYYGNRVIADSFDDQLSRGQHFDNLRARYYKDELITLPDYCNPAYVNEEFEPVRVISSENSFFILKKGVGINPGVHLYGTPGSDVAIIIEAEDANLSLDLEEIMEQTALRTVNQIQGVHAYEKDGNLVIEYAQNGFEFEKIGDTIARGIRLNYPRLEKISVSIYLEADDAKEKFAGASKHKATRSKFIAAMTEENTESFTVCVECRPFSLEHTCVATPGRMPMCGARTYASIKAGGLFGSSSVPYQRSSESDLPIRFVYNKGKVLDAEKGEYEGSNQIYSEFTRGKINRVFLHSLRGSPHTSCGCFQNLAFWIEGINGIGIMSRNSNARTPDGRTWDMLANSAGGKQTDGITGVSNAYIKSKDFLRGDGGLGNVVWMDSKLYSDLSGIIEDGQFVATELNAGTVEDLKELIKR
ncbi:MAG: hypothetical protein FWG10_01155 [Eubacteriaceae bacterium]|nr:hypothetical protein [Eubacteriaceae bacterium]